MRVEEAELYKSYSNVEQSWKNDDRRFTISNHIHGFPNVGFGGYVAGLVGEGLHESAKVDFHRLAPIGTELTLKVSHSGEGALFQAETLLAEAHRYRLTHDSPTPTTWDQAVEATRDYLTLMSIDYPTCFGCGPLMDEGRGLRIFTGAIKNRDVVAAAWTPSPAFASEGGELRPEYVWSALDCPGGWARKRFISDEAAVTAYLAREQSAPVHTGMPHIVMGWPIHQEGRKTLVGMAIFDRGGNICVRGEALWITHSPADAGSNQEV
jgi:hypothetical protein